VSAYPRFHLWIVMCDLVNYEQDSPTKLGISSVTTLMGTFKINFY